MQTESFLRVNVVSGLPGAGKSSVARRLGSLPIAMGCSIHDALRTVVLPAAEVTTPATAIEVFVEAPAFVGPLEIASTLMEVPDSPGQLADGHSVRLGDLVTVIDASRFWDDLRSEAPAPIDEGAAPDDEVGNTVGDALVEQIEWASAVVINKTDLVRPIVCEDIRDFVRLLNPSSHVVFAEHGRGSAASWPAPRADMFAWLQRSPGWVGQLNGEALLTRSPLGLSCVVYREVRPFHPLRLAEFLRDRAAEAGEILRSRGLFTLASRPGRVGSWSSAGPTITFEPTGMCTGDPESVLGQEIAFFGRDLDAHRLTENLNGCLLTTDEFLAGPLQWQVLADPFPRWRLGDSDED
ncbi:GTP-binding protein [Cryobacterium roopkundense]|uniref:G3E family GTPase n=1 Tax=Cryobacterium roopkundense TaxID=1001240 RepID=A0A7W8ZZ15_9MICO|nr:GTP-binding protein [Cryobacterium roopkundense]MBB5642854.1 G3E family GTPase [Cryobacterium roopkundense]